MAERANSSATKGLPAAGADLASCQLADLDALGETPSAHARTGLSDLDAQDAQILQALARGLCPDQVCVLLDVAPSDITRVAGAARGCP